VTAFGISYHIISSIYHAKQQPSAKQTITQFFTVFNAMSFEGIRWIYYHYNDTTQSDYDILLLQHAAPPPPPFLLLLFPWTFALPPYHTTKQYVLVCCEHILSKPSPFPLPIHTNDVTTIIIAVSLLLIRYYRLMIDPLSHFFVLSSFFPLSSFCVSILIYLLVAFCVYSRSQWVTKLIGKPNYQHIVVPQQIVQVVMIMIKEVPLVQHQLHHQPQQLRHQLLLKLVVQLSHH
jgi:hypothetical protein